MTTPVASGFLLAVLLATPAEPQTPGAVTTARPPCAEAPHEDYGYTRERPIQVGGGPMYGAARQRRYLDSLRGLDGQTITYKRLGQDRAPDETILDAYQVTYEGLEKPITLFLDWYHYTEPARPRGFSCAGPIALGLPPVDPFRESHQQRALAYAQAATADLSPIPLYLEGKPPAAVIYDEFRLIALAARAAATKGTPLDPDKSPAALKGVGMVVVIHPYPCEARVLAPAGVVIHGQNGALVPRTQLQALTSDQLAAVLPGITLADGAKAFAYQLSRPRPNDTVVASYSEDGCEVHGNVLRLPVRATPLKPIDIPSPELPPGAKGPAMVYIQAMVDFEGRVQQPFVLGGPDELVPVARAAIAKWRAEPPRFNGAPIVSGVVLQIYFKQF